MNATEFANESPIPEKSGMADTFRAIGASLCWIGHWIGIATAITGFIISFVPGSECGYYLLSAGAIAMGFAVPKRVVRGNVIAGFTMCLILAGMGFQRGIDHSRSVRNNAKTFQEVANEIAADRKAAALEFTRPDFNK